MYCLKYSQKLPLSLNESWDFFSRPENLQLLTPKALGMTITNENKNSKMYSGQIITYTIRLFGNCPFNWVTEITHVDEFNYFIDEQRFGPYKFWHHEHRFKPIVNGTEMLDTIYYMPPFGLLGKMLHHFKIKKDLENIFSYRGHQLEKLFGVYVGK